MGDFSTRLHQALSSSTLREARPATKHIFYPSYCSAEHRGELGIQVYGTCLRQAWYSLNQVEPDQAPNVDHWLAAKLGDQLHGFFCQIVADYAHAAGYQRLAVEHGFYNPKSGVKGRVDLLIKDTRNDEILGIDIKTVGEYKAGTCILWPSEEHVLQMMVYLHEYSQLYPEMNIKRWGIVYLARVETYHTRRKNHGSPIKDMWDHWLEMDGDNPIVCSSTGAREKWDHLSLSSIYERYERLREAQDADQPPPRDFDLSYSEEKILGLHRLGKIGAKKDREAIDKWVSKGCPPGKLKVEKGDFACRFCDYQLRCWQGVVPAKKSNSSIDFGDYSAPKKEEGISFI